MLEKHRKLQKKSSKILESTDKSAVTSKREDPHEFQLPPCCAIVLSLLKPLHEASNHVLVAKEKTANNEKSVVVVIWIQGQCSHLAMVIDVRAC